MKATRNRPRWRPAWETVVLLAVLALTVWSYRDLRTHEFLNYDDNEYVTEHPVIRRGLSAESAAWVWTHIHHATWHPLTGLSHLLDVRLFGLHAPAHLAVNLALHLANTCLLFAVFRRASGAAWASLWAAAAFALHPLHVESVAWVSERKDVLSTSLGLASFYAYLRYAQGGSRRAYRAALVAFVAALLAKPMVVTLPLLWLLFDYWPLGRAPLPRSREALRRWGPLVREKLPFLAAAFVIGCITVVAQRHAGAMEPLAASPLAQRLANAVVAYAMYLRDALWPAGLAVFYPRAQWPGSWVAASLAVLLAITAAALSRVERAPYWIVGWAWYLLGILPVSGILQVGDQARADRFTYLPLAGLFLAAAVSAQRWAKQVAVRRGAVALAGGGILLAWAGATSEQVRVWRNTETLFRHALQVTRDNHVAHANLGAYLVERGRGAEARPHLEEALRLRPLSPLAHISLGVLEMQEGNLAAAEQHFRDVLAALPEHGAAHFNLALVLRARGDRSGALEHVQRALARQPDHAKGLVLLGDLLAESGQVAAAEEAYRKALRAKPDLAAAHNQLALLLEARGRSEEALAHYRELVRLAPDDARAHFNLAAALRDYGQQQEARTHFRRALEIAERQGDFHLAANARAALETPE